MTTKVISVRVGAPLYEAAKILAEHGFDGIPVVDDENHLAGILTEYDMINKGSAVYLPTFQIIFKNLKVLGAKGDQFVHDIEVIKKITVGNIMNTDPLTLSENSTYEEAVILFRDHHRVNPVPVIDKERKVIGVVSRFDVLKSLYAFDSAVSGSSRPSF